MDWTVVNLHMQVVLAVRLGVADALFQNLLGLLNELTVQVNGVFRDASAGVILTEDELRRLSVVLFHLATMRLALFGELLRSRAITARVGFLRLRLVSDNFNVTGPDEENSKAHTLPKHCPRFEASWRARSRRRSYSCSASPLWS